MLNEKLLSRLLKINVTIYTQRLYLEFGDVCRTAVFCLFYKPVLSFGMFYGHPLFENQIQILIRILTHLTEQILPTYMQ